MVIRESLEFSFSKNEVAITANELYNAYFFGQSLIDPKTGKQYNLADLTRFINQAVENVCNKFGIFLNRQVISDESDFRYGEAILGYVKTSYPIAKIKDVLVRNQDSNQLSNVTFEIWKAPRESDIITRSINLVSRAYTNSSSTLYNAYWVVPTSLFGESNRNENLFYPRVIRNFWQIRYETGYYVCPSDLLELICLKSAYPLLNVLGDVGLGAGVASQSFSFDGFSQSLSTTQSATSSAFGARINVYTKQIKDLEERLEGVYQPFPIGRP